MFGQNDEGARAAIPELTKPLSAISTEELEEILDGLRRGMEDEAEGTIIDVQELPMKVLQKNFIT
jgi:predicted transcriptional regulator